MKAKSPEAPPQRLQKIMAARDWHADDSYPGPGSYLIKRDKKAELLLVVGTDLDGAILTTAFETGFLARHPLTFLPSYEALAETPENP